VALGDIDCGLIVGSLENKITFALKCPSQEIANNAFFFDHENRLGATCRSQHFIIRSHLGTEFLSTWNQNQKR
jgi:hypothetical protein